MISDEQRRQANDALQQLVSARGHMPPTFQGEVREENELSIEAGPATPIRAVGANGTPAPSYGQPAYQGPAGVLPGRGAPGPATSSTRNDLVPTTVIQQTPMPAGSVPAGRAGLGPVGSVIQTVFSRYGFVILLGVGGLAAWWVFRKRRKR